MKVRILIGSIISCIFFASTFAGSDHTDYSSHDEKISSTNNALKNKKPHQGHDEHNGDDSIVALSPNAIKDNHIEVTLAGPKSINQTLTVMGKVIPELAKQVKIYPRFPGIVKSIYYQLGDSVKKHDVLLTIESNQSLQNYSVRAPFSGELIKQNVNVGNLVKQDKVLFELADLSSVWVELFIYRKDVNRVSKGDRIYISHGENNRNIVKSKIDYISPIGDEHTQSIIARATLQNKNRKFIPGLYVDVNIIVKSQEVPVAVNREAIQEIDGKKVIFVEIKPNKFEPKVVTLGLGDDHFVQISSGLQAGDRYVAGNSFILKADLEKSSAEHSH